TLDELFKIEQELANVNYEIETLKGTLGKYDSLIDYSTIQINVSEVELYQNLPKAEDFGAKITSTFKESLRSLVELGKGVVLIVVALAPYFVIVGIPVGSIGMIWYKQWKKHKDKHTKE
ncbi:MAG: DUF4349 domain-containing protein, partial [Cellulosilyticaceae bacterium]